PTLKRWLEDSQAMRGFMHELRQAAKQWASRGKPADLVWRGATAQEALGHVKRHVLDLSTVEREFLAEVKAQTARSRRRKLAVFTAIAVTLALVLAGGSFALVRIKLAEKDAQDKAAQAIKAKKEAEGALGQAKQATEEAVKAKGDLQGKLDIIEAEKKQRLAAEKLAEDATKSTEMTKEQLAEANKELQRKVAEAQAAKEKALASEAAAKKATEDAKVAKTQVERMLEKQKAENERLRAESSKIFNGSLSSGGGK
ncbi:MAG TPA: hypothetical protein VMZ53_08540, partial [Kofleriaceae bacterium]|nr:hypothetical protein [Kofleriaceae bacterium]